MNGKLARGGVNAKGPNDEQRVSNPIYVEDGDDGSNDRSSTVPLDPSERSMNRTELKQEAMDKEYQALVHSEITDSVKRTAYIHSNGHTIRRLSENAPLNTIAELKHSRALLRTSGLKALVKEKGFEKRADDQFKTAHETYEGHRPRPPGAVKRFTRRSCFP